MDHPGKKGRERKVFKSVKAVGNQLLTDINLHLKVGAKLDIPAGWIEVDEKRGDGGNASKDETAVEASYKRDMRGDLVDPIAPLRLKGYKENAHVKDSNGAVFKLAKSEGAMATTRRMKSSRRALPNLTIRTCCASVRSVRRLNWFS